MSGSERLDIKQLKMVMDDGNKRPRSFCDNQIRFETLRRVLSIGSHLSHAYPMCLLSSDLQFLGFLHVNCVNVVKSFFVAKSASCVPTCMKNSSGNSTSFMKLLEVKKDKEHTRFACIQAMVAQSKTQSHQLA